MAPLFNASGIAHRLKTALHCDLGLVRCVFATALCLEYRFLHVEPALAHLEFDVAASGLAFPADEIVGCL
jgi:hypothetical protein